MVVSVSVGMVSSSVVRGLLSIKDLACTASFDAHQRLRDSSHFRQQT
jgi:hypothetical protein